MCDMGLTMEYTSSCHVCYCRHKHKSLTNLCWLPLRLEHYLVILWMLCCLSPGINCQAGFGRKSTEDVPPTFFTQQPNAGSPEVQGNTKVLLCHATGYPVPVYRWKKDNDFITAYNITDTSLKIQNIQRSDAGEYQCIASNSHGAILSNRVQVHVAYMVPFANVGSQEKLVDQGQARVVDLPPIDSYPIPSIQWFEGHRIPILTEMQKYHVTLKHQLVVLETTVRDHNNKAFKATAMNSYTGQSSDSQTFVMKVQNVGNSISDIPPSIVVPPSHTTAVQGDDPAVVLECVANSRPLNYLSINWYRKAASGERTPIRPQAVKYLLSMYRRRLTIKNPETSDTGVYECEAAFTRSEPPFHSPATAQANLTVHVKPNLAVPPPSELPDDYGNTVSIPCHAVGTPTPVIRWFRNTMPVGNLGDDRYRVLSDGTLEVSDVNPGDSGMFQCFGTNAAGIVNAATWLRVLSSPPSIVKRPQNQTRIAGDSGRFDCEVTGAPKPDISWYRVTSAGSEDLVNGGRFQIRERELVISLAEVADTGKYVCNATNSRGVDKAEAFLSVLVRTRIVSPPQSVEIIKGSTTVIQCGVTHDDSVTVHWTWFHNLVLIPADDSRRRIRGDGSLEILAVRNQDIGDYKCNVKSSGGNDTANAALKVIELPHSPSITSISLSTESNRAVEVYWSPNFDGNSAIRSYTVEFRLVPPGVDMLENEGWYVAVQGIPASTRSHVVERLQPARTYQFRVAAVNDVGQGPASQASDRVELPQQPPSGPPRGVVGSPRSMSSIIIQWQPPEEDKWNGPLLGYKIRYKPSGYPDSTLAYQEVNNYLTLMLELTSLIVFQEYEISVAAYNKKGVGVFSPVIKVWTQEGKPSGPPRQVTALAFSSESIRLTFLPPDPQRINGINQGYKIQVMGDNVSKPDKLITMQSNTSNMLGQQSLTIQNLRKFKDYHVQVLCFTSKGDGPMSDPVSVKTLEDVPDQVGSLSFANVLDTSLQVLWSAPPNINGVLIGYYLSYMRKNQTISKVTKELSPAILNFTIVGLTATTKYTIEVVARTRVGAGPARSADIDSGIPPELPEPPRNLAITNIRAKSVLLQFIPGFNGHTSISRWIVQGLVGSNTTWVSVFEATAPEATSLTVSGLRAYTQYKLRLVAENIAGQSKPSMTTRTFQTIQDPPSSPPPEVTVRAVNETALRVRWKPLASNLWNGEDRGYLVQIKPASQPLFDDIITIHDENANSYTFHGLEEWTAYHVRVASYNKVGHSGYSAEAAERTREAVPSSGPQEVNATVLDSSSIKVHWSAVPLEHQNGYIRGYKVKYYPVLVDMEPLVQMVEDPTAHSTTLTGLRKYTQYKIQVLAYARMGDGAPTMPGLLARTDEDLPGPPSGVYFPDVTPSSASVFWEPPQEPNGLIMGYRVTYREKGDPPNFAVIDDSLGPGRRDFYVTKLERQRVYIFQISARTRLGWGQSADVDVRATVNRRVPEAPGRPQVVMQQVGSKWVTLMWEVNGDNDDAPLRNYTIQFSTNDRESWTNIQDYIPPDVTMYQVSDLQPFKRYYFRLAASNDVGLSSYSLPSEQVATKQAAPAIPPQNLTVVPKTTTSVEVTWKAPPERTWHGELTGFRLQYRQSNSKQDWYSESFFSKAISVITLQDTMEPLKTYEFRIQAFNAAGRSDWSPISYAFIELDESWNGDPLGYQVWYSPLQYPADAGTRVRRDAEAQIRKPQVEVTYPTLSVELTRLTAGLIYEIKVNAFNGKGHGPFTRPVDVYVGEAVPTEAPQEFDGSAESSTEIKLEWKPPSEASWNGDLLGYKILYWHSGSKEGTEQVRTVAVTETSAILEHLRMFTEYSMVISAFNAAGDGPRTNVPLKIRTLQGLPGMPGELTFIMTSLTTLNVSWAPPANPNGDILNYEVIYYQEKYVEGEGRSVQEKLAGNRHHYLAQGLLENVKYIFNVKAMTGVGWGLARVGNITTGPQLGSPGKPSKPVLGKGQTSVSVEWDLEDEGDSPILGHILQARERGENSVWQTLLQTDTPERQALVSFFNLKPNKEYQFRVIALNQRGISPPSPSSEYLKTIEIEDKPFYQQWWFLIIVALTGVIFIIIVVSLLCLTGRRAKEKSYKDTPIPEGQPQYPGTLVPQVQLEPQEPYIPQTTIRLDDHHMGPTHIDEDAGFSTIETRASQRRSQRKGPRANGLPPYTPYTRSPPRPSPGSVNYSDEDNKFPDDGSSVTDKPSECSDSLSEEPSESEPESEKELPPPPFPSHYANGPVRQSWKRNHKPSNAYSYTDSEPDSQYAVSMNGGHVVMNNMAGSRAPLPGFSSFV